MKPYGDDIRTEDYGGVTAECECYDSEGNCGFYGEAPTDDYYYGGGELICISNSDAGTSSTDPYYYGGYYGYYSAEVA